MIDRDLAVYLLLGIFSVMAFCHWDWKHPLPSWFAEHDVVWFGEGVRWSWIILQFAVVVLLWPVMVVGLIIASIARGR